MNFLQLFNLTGARVKKKADKSKIIGIKTRRNFRRFSFIVKSSEHYSDPGGHITSIMYPKLDFRKLMGKSPLTEKILVKCTDPSFLYWGTEFYASQFGYNIDGVTENRAPEIRDPNGERFLCKHLVRVYLYLRTIDFRTLLRRFNAGNRELTAATVADVQPILKEYVTRNGLGDKESKDLVDSLDEENMEDVLSHHGLLVDEEPHESDLQ